MMNAQMQIDFAKGKFQIRCPMWANDLVRTLPDRRWSKSERAWVVPLLRQSVDGVRRLVVMPGVQTSDAARAALAGYEVKRPKVNGTAFPAWYKFRTKLTRAEDGGEVEFPIRAHQRRVLDKKWAVKTFALHHDMGTGKTRTEIDYWCARRMEGEIDSLLVMVKLSGRRNWAEQFAGPMTINKVIYKEGWAPIPVDVFLPNTDDAKAFDRWLSRKHDFKVLVIGIESLSAGGMMKIAERFMLAMRKPGACVDESSLIMNHQSIRTKNVVKLGSMATTGLRDTMTGTPISTGPLNLFSQFEFLDPDIIGIGDFYAFRNRYAVVLQKETKTGQEYPLIVGYQNIEELTRAVAPYTDEVRKSDVLDLPPKNFLPHRYLQMTKEQREIYDKTRREKAYSIQGKELVVKNVLELALRLHQIAGGFVTTYEEVPYIGRDKTEKVRRIPTWHPIMPWNKNPKVLETVDICSADRQFIIWCAYRAEIEAVVAALSDAYPKQSICQIHGDISDADCATFRHQYQAGKYKFMVGTTSKGGMADTWTACETMVYYSNTEKMIDRKQSEDRAHRDGLDHPVDYIDLVMEKTVDVGMMKSIAMKVDLSEYIRMNIRNSGDLLAGIEPASGV